MNASDAGTVASSRKNLHLSDQPRSVLFRPINAADEQLGFEAALGVDATESTARGSGDRRIAAGGERNVADGSRQAVGSVEAAPARSRQINLAPGVQMAFIAL